MAHGTARAIVLRPGQGRPIDLGNFVMSLKATGDDTDGAFALLEAAEPAGFGPPMHIHHDCAEAFFVLDGLYRIFVEDEEFECLAGSFIYIPSGLRHGFRVGPLPSRKLNLYTPAAMVPYFEQLSAAITSDSATDERLEEIARAASMEIVGPVPEGYL
ncbi:MAG TPA: cupin domain-containing protein [Candidatus Limnocylindria bacterium]|nr:cupin domain-containing protein [Candidatus Limnocylindria bacterium]